MDTEPKAENKKLDEVLIDIERDLWPFLAYLIIFSAVVYFAIKPETFVITAMGIFNLPPQVLMNFYSIAMPLVVAATLSRCFIVLWKAILPYPIAIILFIVSFPFLLLEIYFPRMNWSERMELYLDKRRKKKKLQKSRKFLLSNIILFCSFSILFYACYLGENFVSSHWLPSRNQYMVIISYCHYYCQITGNYNETECKYWKKKLIEYRIKHSILTPIDYPEIYPKM